MVQLHISPTKGNPSSRFFPFHGYLGLTPVRVEGTVRTRLDEDRKPLPAKFISISIRCYESRVSRSHGTVYSHLLVDYTDVLWSKPDSTDWADVGDLDLPFKITLPKRTAGLSTANFQVYRTFWRVEAALEHVPITGVGHRLLRFFDLALIRKPRAPVLRYNISTPTHPVGPNDIIFVSLSLQPLDPNVLIRSATLVFERRIDLLNPPTLSPTSAGSPPPTSGGPYLSVDGIPTPSSSSSHLSNWTPYDSSTSLPSPIEPTSSSSAVTVDSSTASSTRPLRAPFTSQPASPPALNVPSYPAARAHSGSGSSTSTLAAKTVTLQVITTECTGFTRDSSGVWSKRLTLQWPASRSHSRWALGETMHSEHVAVRFFMRATVRVSGPAGTDTVELEPREIAVAATNEAERRLALEKYAEQKESTARSKSKSPWRTRHEHGMDEGGVDGRAEAGAQPKSYPGSPPANGTAVSMGQDESSQAHHHIKSEPPPSSLGAKGKAYLKAARRPYTSAGPRDKSNFSFATPGTRTGTAADMTTGACENRDTHTRGHERTGSRGGYVRRESGLGELNVAVLDRERVQEKERRPKTKERTQSPQMEHVRAWGEEVARMEMKSRRSSSHMFGLWGLGRRKQVPQRT